MEEFRDSKSKRLFEFLKDAYVKDDEVLGIPLDRCGWRSLAQIAQGTGSAPNTLYGKGPGQVGTDLQDLITNGLIEMRYFEGEQGRGVEVIRFRIFDPRDAIQRRKQSQNTDQEIEAAKVPQVHEVSNQEKQFMEQGHRHLATIMFTDMVGYTALGQKDESISLALLQESSKLLRPIFQRHGGRIVKTIGDGFLIQFPDALNGVRCGYDIQRAVREFNIVLPLDKRFSLRIGIHLGDIVESGGDIFGDAVNVASRVEPLADSGGVCLTRQVYDQVRNKIDLRFTSLGEKLLKNIDLPIEVYKIDLPWDERVLEPKGKIDICRIAVLPFANISPDSTDEYFADGMTDEIISNLSKIRELKVISRTSIMRYRTTSKNIKEISDDLQVGSILEGTVRKASDSLRITVQLIDTFSDEHLWTQEYDRKLDSVFGVQKEIAINVSQALTVQLLSAEKRDLEMRATGNTQAYMLYLRGRYFFEERTKESTDKAVRYFEEAIKLDSRYALAYSGLAECYILYGARTWMKPEDSFPKAKQYALQSIEIDPRLAEPHTMLADVLNDYEGMWNKSETEYKLALELKPSYAKAHMWYGLLLNFLTRFEDALEQIKLAIELDPLFRPGNLNLAAIPLYAGRPREAVEQLETALKVDPEYPINHNALGWAYYCDSRTGEGISEFRKAVTMSGGDPIWKADLAIALGFVGQREEASKILRELEEISKVQYISRMKIAQVYFSLGKKDEGFRLLDEAREDHSLFTQHGSYLLDLRLLPLFSPVREDPRWELFVRRLGLPQPSSSPTPRR